MALSSKETIAKNTVFLYLRTLIVLFISLWTSRVILESLGVEDFGIFNAVGGLVTMFSILTGSMGHAISRYITFEIGTGNFEKLKRVFSASMIVQIAFIGIIVILAETIGLWFLNSKMTIPSSRLTAANWVFQFTVVSFCFSLLAIPYNAEVIAHERMKVYAYVGIVENVFRLVIAFSIYISPIDRLVFYSLLMALLSIGIRVFYQFYCKHSFPECSGLSWRIEKNLIYEMGKFAGWNMFGTASITFRTQGISLLLNVFFGPLLNAAYGIANQVNSAVMSFTNSFTTAYSPSITKAYAEGEHDYMMSLVLQGARFSFFLLFVFVLPLLFETERILDIWLKEVPDHAVLFVRLVLILSLIEVLSNTIVRAVLATGNIKRYQIIIGTVALSTIPIAYVFLRFGFNAESTMIVAIIVSLFSLVVRLLIVRPLIGLSCFDFLKSVFLPVCLVSGLSLLAPILAKAFLPQSLVSSLIVCTICVISVGVTSFFVGCTDMERVSIERKIRRYLKR